MKSLYIISGILIVLAFYSVVQSSASRAEKTASDLKYLNCVEEMQKAIPDPNDTETRADFLKNNCHE